MTEKARNVLGVHSIGEFALSVPNLEAGEHFYTSFGLDVRSEGDQLAVRAQEGEHVWARLVGGERKRIHHISFDCFPEDLPRFKAHLEALHIRLLDPPREFPSDGLWFSGHDGILTQIRVGPKTSPFELSRINPTRLESGVRNAPYRRLADRVRIQRLSHVLLFTTDMKKAIQFYTSVLGLRVSDYSADVVGFLHGVHGSDHHMFAFLKSEKPGFHHASWIVAAIDEIGLGAMSMADKGYSKGWGTGRHVLGSNYFNYVQDPWGSWSEYACGIDFIPADQDWVAKDHAPEDGFYLWGPNLPDDFVFNYEASYS